jgi:hypothetical protein
MKGGRVECVGTFEEVRDRNAEFDRLVRLGSLDALYQKQPPDLVAEAGS